MTSRTEPESYETLYAAHSAEVLRLCRLLLGNHHDAEEVAQEVFLKAHQKQQNMEPSELMLWRSWLIRVSINACRDRRRSGWWKWWRSPGEEYHEADYQNSSSTPEQALLSRETEASMSQARTVATFGPMSPRLLNSLNLTAEQKAQIEISKNAFRDAQRAYLTELRALRKEVADKLFGPNPVKEADVAAQITKIADLREKILRQAFRIALDVRSVLRPDQLAKAATIRQQLQEIQTEVRDLLNESQ